MGCRVDKFPISVKRAVKRDYVLDINFSHLNPNAGVNILKRSCIIKSVPEWFSLVGTASGSRSCDPGLVPSRAAKLF